jgi:DNA-nicking Smr family endonuclease
MGDSRAQAFVQSFVTEFIAECRDTLDELRKSKIATGDGNKSGVSNKVSDATKQILVG